MAKRERQDGEMLKGTLDMMVLRTLAPGDAHGHTIAKVIERTSEDVLEVEQGSLYPALHRLEAGPMEERYKACPTGIEGISETAHKELVAVDMVEGRIRWQIPLGSMQDFGGKQPPIPPGSISLGGPIVTAGGLVFIAGTFDPYLRAFDVESGRELWKARLPDSGHATPMTYRLGANGKQYVVISAGGHPKITEESLSDALVAFTLP